MMRSKCMGGRLAEARTSVPASQATKRRRRGRPGGRRGGAVGAPRCQQQAAGGERTRVAARPSECAHGGAAPCGGPRSARGRVARRVGHRIPGARARLRRHLRHETLPIVREHVRRALAALVRVCVRATISVRRLHRHLGNVVIRCRAGGGLRPSRAGTTTVCTPWRTHVPSSRMYLSTSVSVGAAPRAPQHTTWQLRVP